MVIAVINSQVSVKTMTFYQNLKIRNISDTTSIFSFYAVNEIKLMFF